MKIKIINDKGPSSQGTKVFLDDKEINDIVKLQLNAEVNSIITLNLEVLADDLEVETEGFVEITKTSEKKKSISALYVDIIPRIQGVRFFNLGFGAGVLFAAVISLIIFSVK